MSAIARFAFLTACCHTGRCPRKALCLTRPCRTLPSTHPGARGPCFLQAGGRKFAREPLAAPRLTTAGDRTSLAQVISDKPPRRPHQPHHGSFLSPCLAETKKGSPSGLPASCRAVAGWEPQCWEEGLSPDGAGSCPKWELR